MRNLAMDEAQEFESWRVAVSVAALMQGMSNQITDEHWEWFRIKFEEGQSVADVLDLARNAGLA